MKSKNCWIVLACLVASLLMTACGGGSAAPAVNPAGSVVWNSFQDAATATASSGVVSTMLAKARSFFINSATAAPTVFQQWVSIDSYSYGVWITTQGTDKYMLSNGGQYYGVKKIDAAGSLTTILPDTLGQGPASILVDSNKNVYLGGTNNSPWLGLRKLDAAGNVLWTYSIPVQSGIGDQWVRSIVMDSQGFLYFSLSTSAAGAIYKVDSSGNLIWTKQAGTGLVFGTNPSAGKLAINKSDVIYLAGFDSGFGTYVASFDTSGNQLSLVSLSSEFDTTSGFNTGDIGLTNMIVLPNGNLVITAVADKFGNIIFLDSTGTPVNHMTDNILSSKTYSPGTVPCPLGFSDPGFGVTCGPGVIVPDANISYSGRAAVLTNDQGGNFNVSCIVQDSGKSYFDIGINQYNINGTALHSYSIKSFAENAGDPYAITLGEGKSKYGRLNIFGRARGISYLGDSPTGSYYFQADVRLGPEPAN